MSTVGQIEKKTQQRVVKLFRDTLGYDYLGDWTDREDNRNIEAGPAARLPEKQGYDEALIARALYDFDKAAGDTSKSLYDRNRDVYELLRYGVKVKPEVGENTQTVWLIDWKHPRTTTSPLPKKSPSRPRTPRPTKRPDMVLYVNGIALGVLELKRSTVSVAEGIRQNLDNQKKDFIRALLLHDAVGHGGQRHRGPALRRDRDAGEVLPDVEGRRAPSRTRSTGRWCSSAARRASSS